MLSSVSLASSNGRFAAAVKKKPMPPLPSASVSRLSKQSSMSSSRRSKKKKKEDLARIIDSQGRDVTPLPLTGVYAQMGVSGLTSLVSGLSRPDDPPPLDDDRPSGDLQRHSGSGVSAWGVADDDDPYAPAASTAFPQAVEAAGAQGSSPPTDIANETPGFGLITLSETPTFTLFSLSSLRFLTLGSAATSAPSASPSAPYQAREAADNEVYAQLLVNKKDKDRYVTSFAQTLNASQRSRAVQVSERETVSEGVQATSYSIWEAQRELEEEEGEGEEEGKTDEAKADDDKKDDDAALMQADPLPLTSPRGGDLTSRSSASSHSSSQSSSMQSGISAHASSASLGSVSSSFASPTSAPSHPALVLSDSLMTVLKACEEAVLQNVHHHAQLLYRNLAPLPTPGTNPPGSAGGVAGLVPVTAPAVPASLVHLFTFAFPLSFAPPSSPPLSSLSMSFNKANPDLLAVGYGSYSYRHALSPGMLLFWSFHNASYPHRALPTASSVLSVDFSTESPHLLAVGLASGDVAVYDLRLNASASTAPLLQSCHGTGKHREAVWQVKWVQKDRGEQLMSISSDGCIMQWSMKKGLIPKAIMSLKRGQESKEGLSREGSGLCFDFPLQNPTSSSSASQYYAGTEDGVIHRCSVSYNEQVLDNYSHHTGAVYAIRCNPFVPDLFLSASHDWTTALWTSSKDTPLAVIKGGEAAQSTPATLTPSTAGSDVMDLAWNPALACVFAQCTRDGRLEVWDLEQGVLDPVMSVDISGGAQCVTWAGSSVLLVGDDRGRVEVYRVEGKAFVPTPQNAVTHDEQAQRMQEVCYKHLHTQQQVT